MDSESELDAAHMSTDGEALLRAVLAEPAEDTPRLAYADWLQENGQPERAEFIRVQIEICTGGDSVLVSSPDSRGAYLKNRESVLWETFGMKWVNDLGCEWKSKPVFWWHRGFLCGGVCLSACWKKNQSIILAAHPMAMGMILVSDNPERYGGSERYR